MSVPIWVRGRVPNGYWNVRANRVAYMKWLGRRLRYRKPEDWYGLTRAKFQQNHGGGLLATIYRDSPLRALQDFMPDYDWKPWLLASTPQAFWKKRANRRRFMRWFGEQMGFKTAADWYSVTQEDFREHGGNGLLAIYYHNSPLEAVRDFKPKVRWCEWEFRAAPQRFWQIPENRRRYMQWLGKQLGYRRPEDWYRVTRRDFYEHGGGAFLRAVPGGSPLGALREYMPRYDWKEWLFVRGPNGFWSDPANRRRYVRWLGKALGFRKPLDWYQLTRHDVRASGGGALLSMHYNNSLVKLLQEHFPRVNWDPARLYAAPQPRLKVNGRHELLVAA